MSTVSLLDSERLSLTGVARRLNIHVSTVWRYCLKGCRGRRLPSIVIGGRRYVLVRELEQFLSAGREGDCRADKSAFDQAALDANRQLDHLL